MRRPAIRKIKQLFAYEADTGVVIWRVPHGLWNREPAGKRAGWEGTDGSFYMDIGPRGSRTRYPLTHIIWVLVYGRWPKNEIDHRNNDNSDNRLTNLREATRGQNCRNTRLPRNNTSGFKGVSLHRASGLWRARIRIDGVEICLGYFRARDVAHQTYQKAAQEFHGEFARFK